MATQGLITITKGNEVFMKIVAGDNGQNAKKLAKELRKNNDFTAEKVYETALKANFGCRECLVVLVRNGYRTDSMDRLPAIYRNTFDQPTFNPRWAKGTADYVITIAINE